MDHILSMIGLARKAGRVEVGEEPTGAAARAKKARIILLACDAAPSTRRRAAAFAQVGGCPLLTLDADKEQLGGILGKPGVAMAAVTDIGFANAIVKKLAAKDPETYGDVSAQLARKAMRAQERRQEKARHEKNLRTGRKRGSHKTN